MEDYDTFVQRRLSHLRRREEQHNRSPPASSLIRFHGQPILPPLLSEQQREEMQRHRDAAQEAAVRRKFKDESRLAYVQTILHSVQLRKTPTLEELLQESAVNTKSSCSHNTSGGTTSLSLSPPSERKEKDGVSLPPLTSTTYSAFNVTPQRSCLIDQHYSQQGSQPGSLNCASQKSVSSGYVTYENVENTTSVSGRIDALRESEGAGSSDEAYNNNSNNDMAGFFLHNTSNTIAKMPDIIIHPPIDGEELERSGRESSFCNDFIVVEDICCTSLGEKYESSHLDSTEGGHNLPSTTVLDTNEDPSLDRIDGPVSSLERSGMSDNPELSQTPSPHHSPSAELHVQPDPAQSQPAENQDEEDPSEKPYRFSLQALLKKSQEYRRHQRMLRNQAKNTKVQERARAEEQSLSDKENDEFPQSVTVTADGKKSKERKGAFVPSAETTPKKFCENEKIIESEKGKSKSTHLTGDRSMKEITSVEEKTISKNNKLNISQEFITEPKQISDAFPQEQPTLTDASPVQEAFYLTTCPVALYNRVGKYHSIPAPNSCQSPVCCKNKGSVQDGEAPDGAETSKRKIVVGTGLNEGPKVEEVNLDLENSPTAVPSTVNLSVSTKSSQPIDELETNLSSLKVLISDLESTLTENVENHNQTEMQSEFSIEHSHQSDSNHREDKPTDDGDDSGDDSSDGEQDQRDGENPRQSLDSFKNMHEDTGPEPSLSDTDNFPLIETETVNVNELRLVKTLAAERGKGKGTCKEGLTKSYRQHGGGRKPTAKCILSETQRLRIPDVFRNVPDSRSASVLSDTSNRPVESRNEAAAKGQDSNHTPSLNQSYDVDMPSGLWLLEGSGSGSGSDAGSKHVTPESGGEGQGGVSRVKRRLLMHETEETQEGADAKGGAGSVVTPNTSTPRAAVRRYEGLGGKKDKQEQLRQAHAAQVRALQDEHRRQQEELLQALAVRYRLLQSVSFPCSMSSSRLGDTLTFSTLSQPGSPLSERYLPLLVAAAKGFLARRLLKTERVAQLVRTIRDTHQFLQALQQQHSPSRAEFCSRQDLLLQQRVALQLRAARYELHDIFFGLTAGERMQLIGWDRELVRERELRRQSGHTVNPRGKSSLSTATQKSLERKRGRMIQKKAAERHWGVVKRTGHNTGSSAKQPLETKRGQFIANPQRVPKSTNSSRPR